MEAFLTPGFWTGFALMFILATLAAGFFICLIECLRYIYGRRTYGFFSNQIRRPRINKRSTMEITITEGQLPPELAKLLGGLGKKQNCKKVPLFLTKDHPEIAEDFRSGKAEAKVVAEKLHELEKQVDEIKKRTWVTVQDYMKKNDLWPAQDIKHHLVEENGVMMMHVHDEPAEG